MHVIQKRVDFKKYDGEPTTTYTERTVDITHNHSTYELNPDYKFNL